MKSAWYWIDEDARSGAMNMALDVALMDRAAVEGAVFVRLYRWNPHCLSFGRHEPARRRYSREHIEAERIDTVRRPTGGRAVWHARELTYAVAAPEATWGNLPATYQHIHAGLAQVLHSLGAEATLAPRPVRADGPGAGACFASAAGGEILVQGQKVVGSAQWRTGGAVLQHGSLLLDDDQALVSVLGGGPSGGTPLSALLGRTVTWEEAADATVLHALPRWSGSWNPMNGRTGDILERADPAPFTDPDWTWRR